MERFEKKTLGPDTYTKSTKRIVLLAKITRPILRPIMILAMLPIRVYIWLGDWVFDGRIEEYFKKKY